MAEGQTEESFVDEVLAEELVHHGIFVDVHSITTGRRGGRVFRGGGHTYRLLQRDLVLWMKQDQRDDARFSSMVDFYRLPDDFPGLEDCSALANPVQRVECLEQRLVKGW